MSFVDDMYLHVIRMPIHFLSLPERRNKTNAVQRNECTVSTDEMIIIILLNVHLCAPYDVAMSQQNVGRFALIFIKRLHFLFAATTRFIHLLKLPLRIVFLRFRLHVNVAETR